MRFTKILFSFNGRIPRSTWWLANLSIWGAFVPIALILKVIVGAIYADNALSGSGTFRFLFGLLYVCAVWCSLAVTVKRWHDRNKSGYWTFIYLAPVIGPFWALYELGCLEGTQGLNDFEEESYSNNFLLGANDPSLSAPSIVGRSCVHCRKQIVSFISAEPCNACRKPVHVDCRKDHLASAHARVSKKKARNSSRTKDAQAGKGGRDQAAD